MDLDIFVLPDCLACDAAQRMANRIAALHLRYVRVRIVDLSDQDVRRPAAVFAVPTYVLDGRVISLGNPDEEWLIRLLHTSFN